ncbi:MAG TPA: transposase [Candidatus Hydrogenedentes bacterium]|nr:transposase [Candidatus Hydrogenedentota bacterium]HPG66676.1 transposase [Candidatus Hydrogenedentota bacterium]
MSAHDELAQLAHIDCAQGPESLTPSPAQNKSAPTATPSSDPFSFTFLDTHQHVRTYRYHLPHWQQDGTVHFVTFRLGDSIPASVMRAWADDRRQWLAAHGIPDDLPRAERDRRYRQIPQDVRRAFEHEEARRFHVEIDKCHGSCLLRKAEAASILADVLHFYHGRRLHCGDFVIMPNHVHWLLVPYPEQDLETLSGSVKRHSAVRINRLAGRSGRLWQHESFDHIVRNGDELIRIRDYVRDNPGKAKLRSGEYMYHRCDWLDVGEVGAH